MAMDSGKKHSDPGESRVLIIDNCSEILEDFQKILTPPPPLFADDTFEVVLGSATHDTRSELSLEFALSAKIGIHLVTQALAEGRPFSLAFVDANLGTGSNGLRAISKIWELDPDLEIVLISDRMDMEWAELLQSLIRSERLLVLKKPFEEVEVRQLAHAICEKRRFRDELMRHLDQLERKVDERTDQLKSVNLELEKEMRSRLAAESELREAQKLEAVGQLAAGIAHEINTPIQFIGDSVEFLREAFDDVMSLISAYQGEIERANAGGEPVNEETLRGFEDEFDLEFIQEEVPNAITRTTGGVNRVAEIVRGMKAFAHVDASEMIAADLNAAITDTLAVARNEYKYVAQVETKFEDIPQIDCFIGEINQVILNLVVNAAHAISDRGFTAEQGRIRVGTELDGDAVVVKVSDNGGGIPEDIRYKIFDPFFTTKEVGRGTGQGLAIARRIVVESHGGKLSLETTPGEGSLFIIRLPIRQSERTAA